MRLNAKELIADARVTAPTLPPAAANLMTEMADRLDVQFAALCESRDQVKRIAELEARTVSVKLPDEDVSSKRNQPGFVVAVHIDAGDFVKVKGQVFEVKETDFDDHDVTLWFVGGNTLQCAAGCPVEVVFAPSAAVGIKLDVEEQS